MKIKCKRKDCGYEWDYKGKCKFYATCPDCHIKVKINKEVKNEQRKQTKTKKEMPEMQ